MFRSLASSFRKSHPRWLAGVLLIFVLTTTAFVPAAASVSGPYTFVVARNAEGIITLDPALAYDTTSGEIIQNTYETLVFYDGADASAFVPQLADSYNLSVDELTWTFHIRSGVTFHNGASLTASDVAYSFQRGLLQGGSGSPQWLLAEPFFGVGVWDVSLLVDPSGGLWDDRAALQAWNPAELVAACNQVKNAIVANDGAGTVTMTLAQPWGPFLGTIAQTWGSVMDKDWTIANGGWDGSCTTWQNFYAMGADEDPFTAIANGTGPFKLDHWTPNKETVLTRNNSYWRAPAQLERVEIKIVTDDAKRLAMLQSGAADAVMVGASRAVADAMVGEDCVWNIGTAQYDCTIVDAAKSLRRYIGRPGLSQDEVLINFDISADSPYIGSGLLDGNGIPPDFFSDVHIRKALNYCFDWDTFIQTVYGGEFVRGITLPIQGMPGYDLSAPHYDLNLTQCANEFGLADADLDGIPSASDTDDVTQAGFYVQMLYNEGNLTRQAVAEILADNLSQVNPNFVVVPTSLPWPDFLSGQRAGQIPIMTGGWLEDIHDPHNWYQPYLVGTYAGRMHMPDALTTQFGDLIDQGVSANGFAARHTIYQQLNQLVYDNMPFIMLGGATGHSFIQRRVEGRVLNPIFPGIYYYTISHASVTLVSPTDGEDTQTNRPAFEWDAYPGATGYQIQVSTVNDFSSTVLKKAFKKGETSYVPTKDLPRDGTFFWRVSAVTGKYVSPWSETWTFTTGNPPPIPKLSLPGNKKSVAGPSPLFDWKDVKAVTGVTFDHYEIEIGTDASFEAGVIVNAWPVDSQYNGFVLTPGTYYWRVRSVADNDDFSAWSDVRMVIIL